MALSKKNRALFINQEAFGTLSLIENGVFGKFRKLMNKKEADECIKLGYFMGYPVPFSFVFAPCGKRNQDVIKTVTKSEVLDLIKDGKVVGELKAETIFSSEKYKRNLSIFSSNDTSLDDKRQIGEFGISGDIKIYDDTISTAMNKIKELKKELNIQKITALMMSADPFHRVHEKLIRMAIDKADLIIIFLIRSPNKDKIPYDIRKKTLEYFANTFLPQKKVVIVPFENTYLFTGHIHPDLECIAAHNFGATKLVVGQNHGPIGMFFDENQAYTVLDKYRKDLNIEILVMPEYVYCNECKTIVSIKTCPHGQHHHIKYHTQTLKALLNQGILPPAILMRKEISAMILSELFPNRFENWQQIYDDLFPNNGILEIHSQKEFYEQLMSLYQTSSLT